MKNSSISVSCAVAVLALLGAACGGREETAAFHEGKEAGQAATVSVTTVRFVEGKPQITESMEAPAQADALHTTGASGEIAVQYPCGPGALALYDQTGFQGNRLCVIGAGTLDLSTVTRYLCTRSWICYPFPWKGAVRSLQAGASSGVVGSQIIDPWTESVYYIGQGFSGGQGFSTISAAGQNGGIVHLN